MRLRGTGGKHNDLTVRCVFFSGDKRAGKNQVARKNCCYRGAAAQRAQQSGQGGTAKPVRNLGGGRFLNEIPALALATGRELILSL